MKIYHHFEMIYSDWLVKKKNFSIVSLAEAFQKSTAFGLLDFFSLLCFIQIIEDWKFVAMVLDRFFLWLFFVACVSGMAIIILSAPSLYDTRQPIDIKYSKIAQKKLKHLAHDFAFT